MYFISSASTLMKSLLFFFFPFLSLIMISAYHLFSLRTTTIVFPFLNVYLLVKDSGNRTSSFDHWLKKKNAFYSVPNIKILSARWSLAVISRTFKVEFGSQWKSNFLVLKCHSKDFDILFDDTWQDGQFEIDTECWNCKDLVVPPSALVNE